MDVTPQLIEQIEFAEKFRGYDPDEVDEFLERAGTTIAELTNALTQARSDAQREARALVDDALQRAERAEAQLRAVQDAPAPAPAPVAAASMSEEEEAAQATRTLMLARRTADAAIAEAREECQRLVAESRETAERVLRESKSEADRLVGEARMSSDQMIAKASLRAEEEYGAKRNQIVTEIGELEARKTTHAVHIVAVEERIEEYREAIAAVHRALGAVVENPDLLKSRPVEGFDPSAHLAAQHAAPAAAHVEDPAPVMSSPEPAATFSSFDATDSSDFGIHLDTGSSAPLPVDEPVALGGATMLDHDDLAVPYADEANGGEHTDLFAAWPEPELDPEPAAPVADAPVVDAWGPGSWSELAASEAAAETSTGNGAFTSTEAFDRTDLFSDSFSGGFDEAVPVPTSSAQAFRDFPSGGLPVIGQDRYTRDLDEAVNTSDEPKDDAMTAFFEADDTQQSRRFGRRR